MLKNNEMSRSLDVQKRITGLIVGSIAFFLRTVTVLWGSAMTWFVSLGISICISMIAAASLGGIIGLENECLVAELRPPSLITPSCCGNHFTQAN
jgi:ABC-type xylose transport system permease subunit